MCLPVPSPVLSPGAQIAPTRRDSCLSHGSAWCCHTSARPPTFPSTPHNLPGSPCVDHPLFNSTVASRLAPPPHCAGPRQPSPGPQVTLTYPQACVSAPALALPCSASLTFFWSFIPSFLFSGLLAISPSKLHHPLLEAFLDPAGQRRLSTSHLAAYTVAAAGVFYQHGFPCILQSSRGQA